MSNTNNPAGRLLRLVAEAMKINAAVTCRAGWRLLLEVSPQNSSLLFRRIGLVLDIPRQIRKGMESIHDIDPEVYLTLHR